MDRNSCLNYFQAFPFWEHMTEEDQNFLLDNIRELHYPAGAAIQSEERQCLGTLFLLMLSAITFDVQIDAETDCDLLLLPAVPFSRLMKNNIYLENFIYKRTTEHFSDVIAGIERTFFMTLTQRIAAFLLDEAADTGSDELALTQEAIARSIGSAREAVSRSLKKMNKDGSIQISRGSIRILDKRRLYEMMNTF